MSLDQLQALVNLIGVVGALLLGALVVGARGVWVYGAHFKAQCEETETWRQEAMHWRAVAERALAVSHDVTERAIDRRLRPRGS